MPAHLQMEWFAFGRFHEEWLREHPGTHALEITRKWNFFRDDPNIEKVFGGDDGLVMKLPIWREVAFVPPNDLE